MSYILHSTPDNTRHILRLFSRGKLGERSLDDPAHTPHTAHSSECLRALSDKECRTEAKDHGKLQPEPEEARSVEDGMDIVRVLVPACRK